MPTALRVLFLFIFLKPPVAYFRGCAFLSRHSMRLWSHLPFDLFQRWRISEGVFCSKTRHSTLSSFWVLCYTIQLSLTSKILSFFPYLFLSVNLAHLPFRLGCQEGVLIHHRINFTCSATLHLVFISAVDSHGRTPRGRINRRSSGITTVE